MLSLSIDTKFVDAFVTEYASIVHERLNKTINSGLSKTNKRNVVKLNPQEKKLLVKFNTIKTIKHLVTSNSKRLKAIIKYIDNSYPKFHDKNSSVYKILYNAFVEHGYNKIDKFKFIENLKLNTCPYCNRAYIYTINKNRNLKAEIDHFYPKSLYPYLAISFYNLIPSCPTCNGLGAKGNRNSYKDNLKNPYEIKDDDFKFKFDITSVEIVGSKVDTKSIDIYLDKKIKSNDDYFKLESLYQEHRDVVVELYQKFYQQDTKEYFESLKKSLQGISISDEDIYRYITCAYQQQKDFHLRPLSKFIKDISEELWIRQ